jgi:hypothetical protein
VSIHFEAKGPMSTVLKLFKNDFLATLSEQDLKRQVHLTVAEDGVSLGSESNSSSLREQILEVLADDQKSFPGKI